MCDCGMMCAVRFPICELLFFFSPSSPPLGLNVEAIIASPPTFIVLHVIRFDEHRNEQKHRRNHISNLMKDKMPSSRRR